MIRLFDHASPALRPPQLAQPVEDRAVDKRVELIDRRFARSSAAISFFDEASRDRARDVVADLAGLVA